MSSSRRSRWAVSVEGAEPGASRRVQGVGRRRQGPPRISGLLISGLIFSEYPADLLCQSPARRLEAPYRELRVTADAARRVGLPLPVRVPDPLRPLPARRTSGRMGPRCGHGLRLGRDQARRRQPGREARRRQHRVVRGRPRARRRLRPQPRADRGAASASRPTGRISTRPGNQLRYGFDADGKPADHHGRQRQPGRACITERMDCCPIWSTPVRRPRLSATTRTSFLTGRPVMPGARGRAALRLGQGPWSASPIPPAVQPRVHP